MSKRYVDFSPMKGKPIGGQRLVYTKDLIMSSGEVEARDLSTGIENRKFTNWLCREDFARLWLLRELTCASYCMQSSIALQAIFNHLHRGMGTGEALRNPHL